MIAKIHLFILKTKKTFTFIFISVIITSYLYHHYKNNYPIEKIFGKLKIHSANDTLDEIIINNKSISRFGDGEFSLIYGKDNYFQNYNIKLRKRLIQILKSDEPNLLIGINIPYTNKSLERYIDIVKNYYFKLINNNKYKIIKLLKKNKEYYSSDITRFYIDFKDKTNVPNYIIKLRRIWEQKDVVIIEGDKSRLGIGNDLFNNMKSLYRILCPAKNAFKVIDKIINEVINKIDKNQLIMIALGATATVLAYDLYKIGYQVIDIGHIDIEYEWFLRNATNKLSIENKYVAEVDGDNKNFTKVKNDNYYKQIISIIKD